MGGTTDVYIVPIDDIDIMLFGLTHTGATARTMGIPEQSRSAPVEG